MSNRQSAIPNGFTLIEIMLVVVIVLIATAISVPLLQGSLQSTQMTDATRSTVRIARYARSLSVLKQDVCTLHLKEGVLTLSCGETNSAEPEIVRRLPKDIKISSFENLAGVHADREGERVVRYYPSGMNDGFKLTFSDDNDRQATIACHPISGKTTTENGR